MLLHGTVTYSEELNASSWRYGMEHYQLQGTLCFYTEPLDLKWNPDVHNGTLKYLI